MAKKQSAGILMYRRAPNHVEVFLVHPGGPFWAKKDLGSWSLPKGEFDSDEDPLTAARREFEEETGHHLTGEFESLTPLKQPSGKVIHAWLVEGDCDAASIKSNTFTMEWPRGSGKIEEFVEVDRAAWFTIPEAAERIIKGQRGFLDEVSRRHGADWHERLAPTESGNIETGAPPGVDSSARAPEQRSLF